MLSLVHYLLMILTFHLYQLQANLFDTPYAHCLLAIPGHSAANYENTTSRTEPDAPDSSEEPKDRDPLGMALYFFNFSTWTGRPGIYARIASDDKPFSLLTMNWQTVGRFVRQA